MAIVAGSCSRPIAEFSHQGDYTAPAKIQFENRSEKAVSYLWDFGDGATSGEESPSHRYRASGNYRVVLKAVNEKKSRTIEKNIKIDAPTDCLVELETSYGTMLIRLFDSTPQHRDNFTRLAEEGYFDGLLFHRVIDGFMIQGGDPQSRDAAPQQALGSGGPGYTVPAEFVDSLVHVKGALAAARTGDAVNPQKRSSGSQFYIVQGQPVNEGMLNEIEARKGVRYSTTQRQAYLETGGTPFLDRDYTVFGQVIEGLDVIDKIAQVSTDGRDRPVEDVRMKIRVIN